MTFTASVQKQFFTASSAELIRIPPTVIMSTNLHGDTPKTPFIETKRRLNIWTVEEHERFLVGLERFPQGPWKSVAEVVGTKTTRQTMTHAQKYRQKIRRMSAGQSIKIHRVSSAMVDVEESDDEAVEFDDTLSQLSIASDLLIGDESAGSLFEEWELDALLSELGSSLEIDLGDLEFKT